MKTARRLVRGLVIGISMFICMMSLLANPSDSQAEAYTILHNFEGGADDGFQPYYGGPALSGSTLFGMTQGGPTGFAGTLYKINSDGTGYEILHRFASGTDGTTPRSSLTLSGSTLYGFTAYGGGLNGGTIFKIDTSGGGYEVLQRFDTYGEHPYNPNHPYGPPLISGSTLYGLASSDNIVHMGAIFEMNLDGGGFQVLHEFAGKPDDGNAPEGALTLVGSRLYGMTRSAAITAITSPATG